MTKPVNHNANASLIDRHRAFFDLEFMRKAIGKSAPSQDQIMLNKALDPENKNPPNPNPIFDASYYSATAMQGGNGNPILHYLSQSADQYLSPNALFDPAFFQIQNGLEHVAPDMLIVQALGRLSSGLTRFHPFIDTDYLTTGLNLKQDKAFLLRLFADRLPQANPHPLIDLDWFEKQAGQKFRNLSDAFGHYWQPGPEPAVHPLFDADFYRKQIGEEGEGFRALHHYLSSPTPGCPHPLLNPSLYRQQAYEILGEYVERPLEHFLTTGEEKGLSLTPFFQADYVSTQDRLGDCSLLQYLKQGGQKFAPHPLISLPRWRNHICSAGSADQNPLIALTTSPVALQAELCPDFDPDYYSDCQQPEQANRFIALHHFFTHGFGEGLLPNGLLSPDYIMNMPRDGHSADAGSNQAYFTEGLNLRPRLLFAFSNLQDSVEMRSWLAVITSQCSQNAFEIVVLAQTGGALEDAFKANAHVWILEWRENQEQTIQTLAPQLERFFGLLSTNTPRVAFIDTAISPVISQALLAKRIRCVVVIGLELLGLGPDAFRQMTQHADHLLFKTRQIQASAKNSYDLPDTPGSAGSFITSDPLPSTRAELDDLRQVVRGGLGLAKDAQLVVSAGPLDFFHGIDNFGTIAAATCDHGQGMETPCFLWHGSGKVLPNSPAFYAQLQVVVAECPGQLLISDELQMHDLFLAADIYLDCSKRPVDSCFQQSAEGAGLPILHLSAGTQDAGAGYDIGEFVHRLEQNLTNTDRICEQKLSAIHARLECHSPTAVIERLNRILQSLDPAFILAPVDQQQRSLTDV